LPSGTLDGIWLGASPSREGLRWIQSRRARRLWLSGTDSVPAPIHGYADGTGASASTGKNGSLSARL